MKWIVYAFYRGPNPTPWNCCITILENKTNGKYFPTVFWHLGVSVTACFMYILCNQYFKQLCHTATSVVFLNDFFDDGLWGEWNQNVTCLNVVISFSFSASDASGDLQTPLSSGSNVGNNHMKIQRWRGGGCAGSLWVYFPWLCWGDCVQVLPQVEALLCQSIFI